MGYIFLILSKICAVTKMIAVKSSGNIASGAKNSLKINILRSLGCIAVSLIVCAFSGFRHMSGTGLLFTVISGASNGLLLCSWILAASAAPMITVEVFCMIGGVVIPLLISPIILEGESVTLIQWIGSLLLFAAVFCFSKKNHGKGVTAKGILLMCIAGLSNAGCVISQKFYRSFEGGTVADFQLGTFIVTVCVLSLILLFMSLIKRSDASDGGGKLSGKVILLITVAFVMTYASQFLSTVAAGSISASVLYPLAYVISMPLTFIVDVLVFRERVTVANILGLLLVTASGILINI